MEKNGGRFNGTFRTVILAIALIANGVGLGVVYGRTQERLNSIDDRLTRIEARLDMTFTRSEAITALAVRDRRIDRIEQKLDKHLETDK
jgi:hypothetical protein